MSILPKSPKEEQTEKHQEKQNEEVQDKLVEEPPKLKVPKIPYISGY